MLNHLSLWLFSLLASVTLCSAQEHLWSNTYALNGSETIADTPEGLYFASSGVLFRLADYAPDRLEVIGKQKNLSGIEILRLAYEPENKSVIIYYRSGNIDIIDAEGIKNLPAIEINNTLSNKLLSQILLAKGRAYLVGGFGLAHVDLAKNQIEATYFKGNNIRQAALWETRLVALTEEGRVLWGNEQNNLQDPSFWQEVDGAPTGTIALAAHGKSLLCLDKTQQLWAIEEGSPARQLASGLTHIDSAPQGVVGYTQKGEIWVWPLNGEPIQFPSPLETTMAYSYSQSPERIYLSAWGGLYSYDLKDGKAEKTSEVWPKWYDLSDNNFFASTIAGGRYFAVGGGFDKDRLWQEGTLHIRERTGEWRSLRRRNVGPYEGVFYDAVDVAVDASDPHHYFISTWGDGLFEFLEDKFVTRYHLDNSPLATALPGSEWAGRFVRVGAMAFDRQGNLWMTQGGVSHSLVVRTAGGEWHSFTHPVAAKTDSFCDLLITSDGTKWMPIFHRFERTTGIFVFNDRGTLSDTSDDLSELFSQLMDRQGKLVAVRAFYSMALDHNGDLWLGTDKGPLFLSQPTQISRTGKLPAVTRPVGGVEPNLFYLLDNVPIRAIAIDSHNNKWLGTDGEGLYLLSPDGKEILTHYTSSNSPLLSNSIRTLALDETSGLLYIGTQQGLSIYLTGTQPATKEALKDMHAYPNPLRPNDPDLITLSGLTAGMEIRIVDEAGFLLHSAVASGYDYPFIPRRSNGERLAPGIYRAVVYDPQSKLSHVVSFAIVH